MSVDIAKRGLLTVLKVDPLGVDTKEIDAAIDALIDAVRAEMVEPVPVPEPEPPPPPDTRAVADLLRRARTAHTDRKRYSADVIKAEAHAREAIALREQADALDPEHTDPAWSEDQDANKGIPSANLVEWLKHYLTIP